MAKKASSSQRSRTLPKAARPKAPMPGLDGDRFREAMAHLSVAASDAKDVSRHVRQALSATDSEEGARAARIARSSAEEALDFLNLALASWPVNPVWIIAAKVQDLRDKAFKAGVVAFHPETFADPVYFMNEANVPEGMAKVRLSYPLLEHNRADLDRAEVLHLNEIEARREAAKVSAAD